MLLAERGFDPRTSGLWAQHASTAPLCSRWRPKDGFSILSKTVWCNVLAALVSEASPFFEVL